MGNAGLPGVLVRRAFTAVTAPRGRPPVPDRAAEPFTARRRSLRRTRAVLISVMALGPVGRAYTPDWAARRRVKTFDGIAFTTKH